MAPRALILGCRGPALEPAERRALAAADPWGVILFARNVERPAQLRALTADLRETLGRDAPILIDQEGGRVSRLGPPNWRDWPDLREELRGLADPAARARGAHLRARLIGGELRAVGIDVNCAPVLDVGFPGTHPFLAPRIASADPGEVAAIGRATAEGLRAAGVLPVMKHVPGHGRATADSHSALPVVAARAEDLIATDFAPFRALRDLPMAMTAHVVYAAIDAREPATLSPAVIGLVRSEIGFGGLLMTDDLSMGALAGAMEDRVARALAAGCDVILHCNADPEEAAAVVDATPRLEGAAAERAGRALAARRPPEEPGADLDAALAALRAEAAHA